MNPNINSEIQVTLLPSHDGNRQWIWWKSQRRSHEFSKAGDSRVESGKSYRQPTFKSYWQAKSPPEAVYRDTYRQAYPEVDQDATEASYRERNHEVDRMVTEAEFERLLPNQDVSMSQGRCGGNPGTGDRTW